MVLVILFGFFAKCWVVPPLVNPVVFVWLVLPAES